MIIVKQKRLFLIQNAFHQSFYYNREFVFSINSVLLIFFQAKDITKTRREQDKARKRKLEEEKK